MALAMYNFNVQCVAWLTVAGSLTLSLSLGSRQANFSPLIFHGASFPKINILIPTVANENLLCG